nr:hypothetical protein [Mesorhizobium sp. M8A.F.Ca.ET.161.01.1.1]
MVDGLDGKSHYIDIGKGEATEPTPHGCIIRISPGTPSRGRSTARPPRSPLLTAVATASIFI